MKSSGGLVSVVGLLLVALLIAGCGGGGASSSSTSSPGPMSHQSLVKAADASCRVANKAVEAVELPSETPREINRYASEMTPIVKGLVNKLEILHPSGDDKLALVAFIETLKKGDSGLTLLTEATTGSQLTEAASIIGEQPVSRTARSLGAPECAQEPSL
jgi:hypothetical protein